MNFFYYGKTWNGKKYIVTTTLSEVFDRTIPSKDLFSFPWNPYLKTDDILILFLVKIFEEKEI